MGIRRLMAINLMKWLESSVYSFKLTLWRIKDLINYTVNAIDKYDAAAGGTITLADVSQADEYDFDDQNSSDFVGDWAKG